MRNRWSLAAVALAAAALVFFAVLPRLRTLPPEQAVREAVSTFVEGVETGSINRSLDLLSPDFTADGYTRRDMTRGLIALRREYDRINVYVDRLRVNVGPEGDTAIAEMDVAIIGRHAGGREVTYGQDRPIHIVVNFRRDGRRWLIDSAENLPDQVVTDWY